MDCIKNHFGKLLVILLAILLSFIAFFGYKITEKALSEFKTSYVVHTSSVVKDQFDTEQEQLTKSQVEEIAKNYTISESNLPKKRRSMEQLCQ